MYITGRKQRTYDTNSYIVSATKGTRNLFLVAITKGVCSKIPTWNLEINRDGSTS
jgi:hypothetical protein